MANADRDQAWKAGIETYRVRLEERLAELRTLRSWRLMLAASKSYAMLRTQGWRGVLRWVRWIALAPFRGLTGLAEFEPAFPDIRRDIPQGADDYDVVILPLFEFDSLMQRPQHLARELGLRGCRVFWISPSKRPASGESYGAQNLGGNVWEVSVRHEIPHLYSAPLSDGDAESICSQLGALFREHRVKASCVIVQLPFWRKAGLGLRRDRGCLVAYDCMDDWQTFPGMSEFVRSEEARLLDDSDLVFVSARGLQQRHSASGSKPVLVRNAADFELFAAGSPDGKLESIPRPIVGYFGAIAEWFDFDLVRAVAAKRPNYSFVIIGNTRQNRVTGPPNLHLLGEKPYGELARYLAQFDACMIPFVQNPLTDVTDPVKLYEYFSQGKPVIATDLRELHEHANIYFSADAESFASNIDRALHEGPDPKAARIAFASQNTWKHRAAQIDTAIRDLETPLSIQARAGRR